MTGFAVLLSLLLVGALLWLFAPTTIGGNFSYVTVTGNSMSPLVGTGDLVLLRRSSDYEIGQAVAYRHPQIGIVLHRIVADDGERFTLRGDNRAGEDTYQPTRSDVVGREWIILPNGGRVLRVLQRPRNLALLVAATLLLIFAGGKSTSGAAHRRRAAQTLGTHPSPSGLSAFSRSGRQALAVGGGLALISIGLLGLIVVNRPVRTDSEAIPFTEQGTFVYGGPVAAGVYDGDLLVAPEPLYRQLVDELPIRFNYDLTSGNAGPVMTNISGSVELTAQIVGGDGWTRTYLLYPRTQFTSAQVDAVASLDLAGIEADLVGVSELTGVASNQHVVRVVANVQTSGLIDGVPFETDYQHLAQFRMTPLALQFDGTADSLTFSESRSVARQIVAPRVLELPMIPFTLSYRQFPLVGGLGLVVSFVLLLLVARATRATSDQGEAARISAAHGALLVKMVEERATLGPRPHGVSQFSDLVRLAAMEGLAIMHRSGSKQDEYFVLSTDRSWRYAVQKTEGATVAAAVQIAVEGRYITTSES